MSDRPAVGKFNGVELEATAGAEPVVGAVYGVRTWYINTATGHLRSPVLQTEWTPGEPLTFECRCYSYGEFGMVGNSERLTGPTVQRCPHPRIAAGLEGGLDYPTACGIHGYHWEYRAKSLDYAGIWMADVTYPPDENAPVMSQFYAAGIIKAWGHIVTGSQGFRAEHARVVAFLDVLPDRLGLNEAWADVPLITTSDEDRALELFPELATPPS